MRKRNIWRRFDCRILAAVIIATVCFLIGLAIPFIIHSSENRAPKIQLTPHSNPIQLNNPIQMDYSKTLNDVFITVKTTQQFHYPRLVILLETWVSLVKNQVELFTWNFLNINISFSHICLNIRRGFSPMLSIMTWLKEQEIGLSTQIAQTIIQGRHKKSNLKRKVR